MLSNNSTSAVFTKDQLDQIITALKPVYINVTIPKDRKRAEKGKTYQKFFLDSIKKVLKYAICVKFGTSALPPG